MILCLCWHFHGINGNNKGTYVLLILMSLTISLIYCTSFNYTGGVLLRDGLSTRLLHLSTSNASMPFVPISFCTYLQLFKPLICNLWFLVLFPTHCVYHNIIWKESLHPPSSLTGIVYFHILHTSSPMDPPQRHHFVRSWIMKSIIIVIIFLHHNASLDEGGYPCTHLLKCVHHLES